MIPTFSHCQECGNPAIKVEPLWGIGSIAWWCRYCKIMLREVREKDEKRKKPPV